jgi:hypothetical protein
MQLAGLRLMLISSHFAAHDEKVERRNADFHRIRTGLFNNTASRNSLGGRNSSRASSNGSLTGSGEPWEKKGGVSAAIRALCKGPGHSVVGAVYNISNAGYERLQPDHDLLASCSVVDK